MDDDEALQKAIQMSLEMEENKGDRRVDVVDLTRDDDEKVWSGFDDFDEMDVYKAIAISMGEGMWNYVKVDCRTILRSVQKVQVAGSTR
jgi:hypothetical protein